MKKLIVTLALVSVAGSAVAQAQPRRSAGIPGQFHGRWGENHRECGNDHFTTVIRIERDGWSSFEQGGNVTRAGQVRTGTHYFRVDNYSGAEETKGSLALRRAGARILMSFQEDGQEPVHYNFIRCR